MGTITTGTGLISGINTAQLIEQLMAIESRPKQLIESRVTVLQSQNTALAEISAKLLGLQSAARSLTTASLYKSTTASSSDTTVLNASSNSAATPGTYSFVVNKLVSTQQTITRGFSDATVTPLASGTLSFEFGDGRLDSDTQLSALNGGDGVTRGKVRITDRMGNAALVDLSKAVTVKDVLEAINGTSGINVTASVWGDSLRLTDTSGGSGTLSVANVGATNTAASLGLTTDTDGAANTLTGAQINSISTATLLTSLNDGNGVAVATGDDLTFTRSDATTFSVDLSAAKTVGDVINAINNVGGFVTASIASNGVGLQIDFSGGGTLDITGTAAQSLGLSATASATPVAGRRILAGINSKLLSNLNGGAGVSLGTVTLTPRSGTANNFTVDLSSADSINDVINLINHAVGNEEGNRKVTASLNRAGNGILLTDVTASASSNLIINGTGLEDLGFADGTSVASNTLDSGNLQFRYIAESTRLTALHGGQGVSLGKIAVTDSRGISAVLDLSQGVTTIRDVLDKINSSGLQIGATINANGDGILLQDTGPGNVAIKVEESGGTTARDLGILGQAATAGANLDGSFEKTITIPSFTAMTGDTLLSTLNGGAGVGNVTGQSDFSITTRDGNSFNVDLDALTTMGELINAINTASGGSVTAAINSEGTALQLTDNTSQVGSNELRITAMNNSTAAADLGLGSAATLSGSTLTGGTLVEVTTLTNLADKISALGIGIRATIINDGSAVNPYRLSFISTSTGKAGAFLFDDGGLDYGASNLVEASNAVVFYGSSDIAQAIPIISSTNTLSTVIPNATIDLKSASDKMVQVTIARDDSAIVAAVNSFVTSFNGVMTSLNKYDSYDSETKVRGLLLGDATVARVRNSLFRIINGRNGDLTTQYNSLSQLGITVGTDSQLSLDSAKLSAALANDRTAVEKLFTYRTTTTDADTGKTTTDKAGIGWRLADMLTSLADSATGTVPLRINSINTQIEQAKDRIKSMETLLAAKKIRMQTQYANMENVLATLQSQSTAISNMSVIISSTKK